MPPRFAYWTIIAGGLPTAFRAAEREELLPTFRRIHDKHPDAEMKYFARGRLWASPEEAKQEAEARRAAAAQRGRRREGRGPDWRPGGEHRDPRQPFKDAKQARNRDRRKVRFERRQRPTGQSEGPSGRPPRPPQGRPQPRSERQGQDRPARRGPDRRRRS